MKNKAIEGTNQTQPIQDIQKSWMKTRQVKARAALLLTAHLITGSIQSTLLHKSIKR